MPHTSVVRIYATTQRPDYDSPWQSRVPSSSTGSGVVIAPHRILTGAHVVANATFLQVQRVSDPNKVLARVVGICHDCDLALLEIIDAPDFMDGITPAEVGELPDLRDRVSVVGFPIGGQEVSVTEGVVSRIEVQRYSHSQRHLLAVTVDAAINKGNSGGPVLSGDGRVVGIAFQKLSNAEAIGEMVPAPIIRHFLDHAETTPRLTIPLIGVATQGLENPALRAHLGLHEDETGVVVVSAPFGGSAHGVLEVGDAILAVEDHPIANNSTVRYLDRYRTRYDVMIGWKSIGDPLRLRILRDGERRDVTLTLQAPTPLVPASQYDVVPTYFIYGGLVFQTLCRDFLSTWDRWWNKAPKEFLHLYYSGERTEDRSEVVILTQVLADAVNVGYSHLHNEAVASVNGVQPRDMRHFVDLIEAHADEIVIETSSRGLIVLDPKAASDANASILSRYRIAQDRSPDLV